MLDIENSLPQSKACFTSVEVPMEPPYWPKFAVRGVVSSQWAYWCSLASAAMSVTFIPPGSVRTLVILTPTLTALLCVFIAYWLYRQSDEYIQLRLLRCVTITAIVVMFCTLGYFFMELFGFPHVSLLWVNLLGWSVFNVQLLFVVLRAR
jgi:hypothetical protein